MASVLPPNANQRIASLRRQIPEVLNFKKATALEKQGSCNICHRVFYTGETPEMPAYLPCGHLFGASCIIASCSDSNESTRCPTCGSAIFDTTKVSVAQTRLAMLVKAHPRQPLKRSTLTGERLLWAERAEELYKNLCNDMVKYVPPKIWNLSRASLKNGHRMNEAAIANTLLIPNSPHGYLLRIDETNSEMVHRSLDDMEDPDDWIHGQGKQTRFLLAFATVKWFAWEYDQKGSGMHNTQYRWPESYGVLCAHLGLPEKRPGCLSTDEATYNWLAESHRKVEEA